MRLRLSAPARKELAEAMKYHEGERTGLAHELAEEIDRAVRLIREQPMAGTDIGRGERKFTIDRFRYNIIYRMEEESHKRACHRPSSPKAELLAQAQAILNIILYT